MNFLDSVNVPSMYADLKELQDNECGRKQIAILVACIVLTLSIVLYINVFMPMLLSHRKLWGTAGIWPMITGFFVVANAAKFMRAGKIGNAYEALLFSVLFSGVLYTAPSFYAGMSDPIQNIFPGEFFASVFSYMVGFVAIVIVNMIAKKLLQQKMKAY